MAVLAARSLMPEVATFPKPGLVSHVDRGSHADRDAGILARSLGHFRGLDGVRAWLGRVGRRGGAPPAAAGPS